MVIKSVIETSLDGMYKVTTEDNDKSLTLFIRKEYIPDIDFESILPGNEYDDEQTEFFLDAALTGVVELKAMEYLARAEQCKFGLCQKLIKKGYDKKSIERVMDFLEAKNYLNDERFSTAWLNTRKLNHFEGKNKLTAELQARGISKETAESAIKLFFQENDETSICIEACKRFIKKGKSDEKLVAALMNAGFSYKLIKIVKEECSI